MQPNIFMPHYPTFISPKAQISRDVQLAPNVVIYDNVSIGEGVRIGANTVIGAPPKTIGATASETGKVVIERNTYISENCVIDAPIKHETYIGENVYIMPFVYIGHDTTIEKNVVITAGTKIGGYVHIGQFANLGLNTCVHQFATIGDHALTGMNSVINSDVPPFAKVYGSPARYRGINSVGLLRNDFNETDIALLKMRLDNFLNGNNAPQQTDWEVTFSRFEEIRNRQLIKKSGDLSK